MNKEEVVKNLQYTEPNEIHCFSHRSLSFSSCWNMLDFILIIALVLSSFYLFLQKMSRQNGSKDKYGFTGQKKKAIFITGCDSGFGYSLILHNLENFDDNNVQLVIAGCYFPGGNSEGNIICDTQYSDKSRQKNYPYIQLNKVLDIKLNISYRCW